MVSHSDCRSLLRLSCEESLFRKLLDRSLPQGWLCQPLDIEFVWSIGSTWLGAELLWTGWVMWPILGDVSWGEALALYSLVRNPGNGYIPHSRSLLPVCLESAIVERYSIFLWGMHTLPKLARNLRCQAAEGLAIPEPGKEFYHLKLIPEAGPLGWGHNLP